MKTDLIKYKKIIYDFYLKNPKLSILIAGILIGLFISFIF